MSSLKIRSERPPMSFGHALHVAALRLWRRFPWPGGRGRYWFKNRLLEGRRGSEARPIPTEVGWLWLEWGEDVLQSTLYAGGHHYEGEVTAYLRSLDLTGRTVLDVGAHAGFYSVLLARAVGSAGKLIAFEPQAKLAASTERSLAASAASWAQVERMAVGDQNGLLTLHLSKDSGRTTAGQLPDGELKTEDVPMVRLDRFILERLSERPVLIKIDIEGAEWLALQGLEKVLVETPAPRLVIEMHPRQIEDLGGRQEAIVDMLEGHGFSVRRLHHRSGLVDLERPFPANTTWHLVAEKPAPSKGKHGRSGDEP